MIKPASSLYYSKWLEKAIASFVERQMVSTACLEVDHLFQARYKVAAQLLRKLADAPTRKIYEAGDQESYQLLKRFGLLIEQGGQFFIPMVIRQHFKKIPAA